MNARTRVWVFVIVVGLLLLAFGRKLSTFYTDWLWFGELGYRSVFWTSIKSSVGLGFVMGTLFFVIVYLNLWWARKLAPPILERYEVSTVRMRLGRLARRGFDFLVLASALAISVLAGIEASTHWMDYQFYTHASAFGDADPIFHKDAGFYMFNLGFIRYVYAWLFSTIVVATLGSLLVHYVGSAFEIMAGVPTFAPRVKAHLSILVAAIMFLKAWGYRLNAYDLLFSPSGVVFGAGYADVYGRLIALKIMSVLAVVAGIIVLVGIPRRGIRPALTAIIGMVAASLLLGVIYPQIIQSVYVKPNELRRESRFIGYNIQSTRKAFDLLGIEEHEFPALQNLTARDIENNRTTINSIRLWDYRPLDKTYSQLQELGPYYRISNVDVDRYTIAGETRQVTLAAREISLESASAAAGTWVNQHFQYTHGYGAVMSPVNRATEEGLPDFFISGIPPRSTVGIRLDRPQIYFGEMTHTYVVVNSKEKEFDYPAAGKPVYTRYNGRGGIGVANPLRRIAFAWRFSDMNLLLRNPISRDSRIMFRRDIPTRVREAFPFLFYDEDPYLVVSNGKLYWMIDAYTVSRSYPYSTPHELVDGFPVNYIRNSVKVVVDAYDGTVDYYLADTDDPIIRTYQRIFPGVFKPLTRMPADLLAHVRYPEMLFRIQSEVLLTYHMKDPHVFYNKAEKWAIPNEIVGVSKTPEPVEPYYVVMKLPSEAREQFLLMRPFTLVNKDYMTAWLAASCEPTSYGRMVLYHFPQKEQVFGPAQIESRINQDPMISAQITLWGQRGSQVNRGNLLVIPIEQSVLYVEPLYLESETSKIPELKRVIVAYGNRIAMEPTLDAALARIFGTRAEVSTTSEPGAVSSSVRNLINEAATHLRRAKELQGKGDWAGYGEEIRRLEDVLERLQEITQSGGET